MEQLSYIEARDLLLEYVNTMSEERVPLADCFGRVLAKALAAAEDVPPFDRSPYDGYAFRARDTVNASQDNPVTLRILEEIPAGGVSHVPVTENTAVKVLTGAPIPSGADAVVMFEKTRFTETEVTLFAPAKPGENIVTAGEDVKKGTVLAEAGTVIDPGLMGTLASQNSLFTDVYRIPKVGIISTGSELMPVGSVLEPGKIYDSNQYTLSAALKKEGCMPIPMGIAKDNTEAIAAAIEKALDTCDAVVLTGGVSVGDYDLTPAAMEAAGAEILFSGVAIKPGMACAYGVRNGKLICALSGNPASSLTNFYAIALPAMRKLCGRKDYIPREITVTLADGFRKKSHVTRLLRGKLDLSEGNAVMHLPKDQGNVVLSSTIGCDVMAVIPAGSDPIPSGGKLKGFLI